MQKEFIEKSEVQGEEMERPKCREKREGSKGCMKEDTKQIMGVLWELIGNYESLYGLKHAERSLRAQKGV